MGRGLGSKTAIRCALRPGASEHPAFAVALYVTVILARRLDAANRWLVAVKRHVETGEPSSVIGKAVEKVEELLSYGGRDPTGW